MSQQSAETEPRDALEEAGQEEVQKEQGEQPAKAPSSPTKLLKLNIAKFSGSNSSVKVDEWVDLLETELTMGQAPKDMWSGYALLSLEPGSEAATYIRTRSQILHGDVHVSNLPWASFKAILLDGRFGDKRGPIQRVMDFLDFTQGSKNVDAFIAEYDSQVAKLSKPLTEEVLIAVLLRAVSPELKQSVRTAQNGQEWSSVAELRQAILRYGHIDAKGKGKAASSAPPPRPPSHPGRHLFPRGGGMQTAGASGSGVKRTQPSGGQSGGKAQRRESPLDKAQRLLVEAGVSEAAIEQRKAANKCIACGSEDHRVANCPSDAAKRAQIAKIWSAK